MNRDNIDIRSYRTVNKTIWDNFPKVCRDFRYDQRKFKTFIEGELGTTSEFDHTFRLVIVGRYDETVFEELIIKYQSSRV